MSEAPDEQERERQRQCQREYRWRKANNLVLVSVPVSIEDMEFLEAHGFWRDGQSAGIAVHNLIRHQRVQMKASAIFAENEKKKHLAVIK